MLDDTAKTPGSGTPVLSQYALVAGQTMADTTCGLPLSLLLPTHVRPLLNVTDSREAFDRREVHPVVLQHP